MYVIFLLEEREVEDTNKKEHLTYDTCQKPPQVLNLWVIAMSKVKRASVRFAQLNSAKEKKMCLI